MERGWEMTEQEIRKIVRGGFGARANHGRPAPYPGGGFRRHVHLTAEAVEKLFGKGAKLTQKRPLSQPGEFLSDQRVKLVTAKGEICQCRRCWGRSGRRCRWSFPSPMPECWGSRLR